MDTDAFVEASFMDSYRERIRVVTVEDWLTMREASRLVGIELLSKSVICTL